MGLADDCCPSERAAPLYAARLGLPRSAGTSRLPPDSLPASPATSTRPAAALYLRDIAVGFSTGVVCSHDVKRALVMEARLLCGAAGLGGLAVSPPLLAHMASS